MFSIAPVHTQPVPEPEVPVHPEPSRPAESADLAEPAHRSAPGSPFHLPNFAALGMNEGRGLTVLPSLAGARSMHDTLSLQVSRHRRQTLQCLEALSTRLRATELSPTTLAAVSRLAVVTDLLESVPEPDNGPTTARRTLALLRQADQLMERVEDTLKGDCFPEYELVRRACLDAAQGALLPTELDPDFLGRVVAHDLQRPDFNDVRALSAGQNIFQSFRPQFSCWKDVPLPLPIPPGAVEPSQLSDQHLLEIWCQLMTRKQLSTNMTALEHLCHDRDAEEADVNALLNEWMKLSTEQVLALLTCGATVVMVRQGTPAAERVFGGRPAHEQARYCPDTRTLVVGVRPGLALGSPDPDIPSTHSPYTDGRPPRFWTEVGRMLVRGAWEEPAVTELDSGVLVRGRDDYARMAVDCTVELPRDSFLEALAADADDGPLGFPLGVSEEETHARVVARYLCGDSLPSGLAHYVRSRLGDPE